MIGSNNYVEEDTNAGENDLEENVSAKRTVRLKVEYNTVGFCHSWRSVILICTHQSRTTRFCQ